MQYLAKLRQIATVHSLIVGAVTAGVVALALSAWTFDPKLSLSGDNAEFITLARSVAAGHGLKYINDPTRPVSSKYPFGLPLMLAPLAADVDVDGTAAEADGDQGRSGSGQDWIAMKWLVAVIFGLGMSILYLYAHAQLGWLAAVAVVALVGTNQAVVDYSHQVMSEVPYMSFSILALLLVERMGRRDELSAATLVPALLGLMAAYYTRTVGMVLISAAVVAIAVEGRWRRALVLGGATFLLALPWSIRNHLTGQGSVYLTQLVLKNPYYPEQGIVTIPEFFETLVANGQIYLLLAQRVFLSSLGRPETYFNPAAMLCVLTLVASGMLAVWRGRQLLPVLYLIQYILTLLMWPWPADRFLIPAVPVVIFLGVWTIREGLAHIRASMGHPAALVLTGALFLALLGNNIKELDGLASRSRLGYPPQWQNYYSAGEWIRDSTDPKSLICCRKPFWMHVVSERSCISYPFKEPDEIMAYLRDKGTDYLIDEELGFSQTRRFLWPTIGQNVHHFEFVWFVPYPSTFVMRLRSESEAEAVRDDPSAWGLPPEMVPPQ